MENLKKAIIKTSKALWGMLPIILGTILLVSLANTLIPVSLYTKIFGTSNLLDSFIGAISGSVLFGNPIESYIIGGELLKQGVSLIAVTAFILSWVTVGMIQLPAEASILGKKFAVLRNATAFILAIISAIITILIVNII